MNAPRISIWGMPDHCEAAIPGSVWAISTPSHGGYAVDPAWAKAHLSKECIAIGDYERGYLWFEEDCAWAVLAWETPALLNTDSQYAEENRASMLSALRMFYPLYCLAHSIDIELDYAVKQLEQAKRYKHGVDEWTETVTLLGGNPNEVKAKTDEEVWGRK